MIIPRYIEAPVRRDLKEKMVFISGSRQVGKTVLAKTFLKNKDDLYYNWDRRKVPEEGVKGLPFGLAFHRG